MNFLRNCGLAATLLLLGTYTFSPAQGGRDSDRMEDLTFQTSFGVTLQYLLFTPENYDPSQSYPLVVTLHGSGSDYIYQVDNNDQARPWIDDSIQARVPHFFMAPGAPGGSWGGMMGAGTELSEGGRAVIEAIEDLKEQYSLDTTRFIITGFSLGGAGTYHQIQFMPDFWAAAVPSAAGGSADAIEVISNTPIWHHQGSNDGGGAALTRMADAMEASNIPILRISSDIVITSPSGWQNQIQGGADPGDLIFRNSTPSYEEINSAIDAGERYLFQMIEGGSHEDARINANHNPLVAKWAFMQRKGGDPVPLVPHTSDMNIRLEGAVLKIGHISETPGSRLFTLLGRAVWKGEDAVVASPNRALRIEIPPSDK